MLRTCLITAPLLLLLIVLADKPAYAAPQPLGEAAGITWKQARLAPGWRLEMPAYWQEESELPPEILGRCSYPEFGEFISLIMLSDRDEMLEEAIRSSRPERAQEIMGIYAGAFRRSAEKKGQKFELKEASIEIVDKYGAMLIKYRIEYSDTLSASLAQYLLPLNGGVYCLTIGVDRRALDYMATALAQRIKIDAALGENGGIPIREVSKGYPAPEKPSPVKAVAPQLR